MAVLTAMNKIHHYNVVSVLHQPQCQTLDRLITYVLVSERMSLWNPLLVGVASEFFSQSSSSQLLASFFVQLLLHLSVQQKEAQELASEMSNIDDLTNFITSVECSLVCIILTGVRT